MRALLLSATALIFAGSAQAATNLIQNGGFEDYTLTAAQQAATAGFVGFQVSYPGGAYSNAVDGWFSAQGGAYSNAYNLYFFDGATAQSGDAFSQYPSEQQRPNVNFSGSSPDGGAFMILDADPIAYGPFTQTVNGLTAGRQYKLGFWWAAGELSNRTGYETVTLTGSFGADSFSTPTFFNSKPWYGPNGNLPGDFSGWTWASYKFTAATANQVLTFLAVGTPANNLPPVAFLDGVTLTVVPEPGTWALMIAGFGLAGAALRRRRALAA